MKKNVKVFVLLMMSAFFITAVKAQKPSPDLLTPTNHELVLIDEQSQMGFATENIEMVDLRNNAALVAGASKLFNVPIVLSTVAAKSFSGPFFPELLEIYPPSSSNYIDRTTMNAWEDLPVHKAILAKGKKKIVLAGLWTSVCIVGPALSAIAEGYEVYVITDACGDVSEEAHLMAIHRMIKAGATPMTSMQYVLELQRDWARQETYKGVTDLIKKYGGTYGIGVQYSQDMIKH